MIFLDIKAKIRTSKLLEFSQAKLDFIDKFQSAAGYISYNEKSGEKFQMEISWDDEKTLSEFMESDEFRFFNGAILALGESRHIAVVSENQIKHWVAKK